MACRTEYSARAASLAAGVFVTSKRDATGTTRTRPRHDRRALFAAATILLHL